MCVCSFCNFFRGGVRGEICVFVVCLSLWFVHSCICFIPHCCYVDPLNSTLLLEQKYLLLLLLCCVIILF